MQISALSTRIWIFLNPQLFLSDSKISTSTRIWIQIKSARPHVSDTYIRIHSSTQDSSGNIGNRACVIKRAKFASCNLHRRARERTWERDRHLEYSIHGKVLDLVTSLDKKYPELAPCTVV